MCKIKPGDTFKYIHACWLWSEIALMVLWLVQWHGIKQIRVQGRIIRCLEFKVYKNVPGYLHNQTFSFLCYSFRYLTYSCETKVTSFLDNNFDTWLTTVNPCRFIWRNLFRYFSTYNWPTQFQIVAFHHMTRKIQHFTRVLFL